MSYNLQFFLICILCNCFKIGSAVSDEITGCQIDVTSPDRPLVLSSDLSDLYFSEPVADPFHFNSGVTVTFVCPGSSILLKGRDTGAEIVEATCDPELGVINYTNYKWSEVLCKTIPQAGLLDNNETCGKDAEFEQYSVGFSLNNDTNITIYTLCYSTTFAWSLFSYHRIIPWRKMSVISGKKEINTLWLNSIDKQRELVNKLARVEPEFPFYIGLAGQRFFINRKLVPKEDFFHPVYQNSTYNSMNFVPQYERISNGNWMIIETLLRKYVEEKKISLEVWTGVYGIVEAQAFDENAPIDVYVTPELIQEYDFPIPNYNESSNETIQGYYSSIESSQSDDSSSESKQSDGSSSESKQSDDSSSESKQSDDSSSNESHDYFSSKSGETNYTCDDSNMSDDCNDTTVHIFTNDDGETLAAPVIFWKVLYHRPTKRGIALVTVNNPYNLDQAINSRICKQNEFLERWFKEDENGRRASDNIGRGYSFSCNVDELRDTIDYIPQLEIQDLLLW